MSPSRSTLTLDDHQIDEPPSSVMGSSSPTKIRSLPSSTPGARRTSRSSVGLTSTLLPERSSTPYPRTCWRASPTCLCLNATTPISG